MVSCGGGVVLLQRMFKRMGMLMKFHQDGTLPLNGEVFVFGSNLAGVHGAGAAKAALEKFGAVMGRGRGLQGNSWAIPTKDEDIKTMHLAQIGEEVIYFLNQAESTPAINYFVTRIGCGLAGYTDADIAPMFRGAPDNCSFAEQWKEYL